MRAIIAGMTRPRSVWLVAAPLMAAASLGAHGLAYRLASRVAGTVADDTHGYLAYLSLAVAPAAALVLVILALRVLRSDAGVARRPLPWTPFAVAPPVAFALQEHLERLLATGAVPFSTATEPTFVLGLALQFPFALAAYAATRALLGSADRIAAVRARSARFVAPSHSLTPVAAAVERLLPARVCFRPNGRSPPLVA